MCVADIKTVREVCALQVSQAPPAQMLAGQLCVGGILANNLAAVEVEEGAEEAEPVFTCQLSLGSSTRTAEIVLKDGVPTFDGELFMPVMAAGEAVTALRIELTRTGDSAAWTSMIDVSALVPAIKLTTPAGPGPASSAVRLAEGEAAAPPEGRTADATTLDIIASLDDGSVMMPRTHCPNTTHPSMREHPAP